MIVTHAFDCAWPHGGKCSCDFIVRKIATEGRELTHEDWCEDPHCQHAMRP